MKTRYPVIWMKKVSFSFGSHAVVENADIDIRKGDFVGMIGPNGSGKTTLVKLMLGLLEPDAGEIRLFGMSPKDKSARMRVGYVPQKATNFDQNFPATVYEVAGMGRTRKVGLLRSSGSGDMQAIENALDIVGMLGHRGRRISELSGGQQQRVFIARALAAEPDLLILDEPTVGVDIHAQREFYRMLKQLNDRGITIILISHDIAVVSRHVNRILCVNRRVVFHNPSKGISEENLMCAYQPDMARVVHESHEPVAHGHHGERDAE
jgi:zinc transport system ATP-binding protein